MENLQELIILIIVQFLIQFLGIYRHNANIKRRFKRLEDDKLKRRNDRVAQTIHAMASKSDFGKTGSYISGKVERSGKKGFGIEDDVITAAEELFAFRTKKSFEGEEEQKETP